MDSQPYAFLDEVWGSSDGNNNNNNGSPNAACELLKKTKKQSIMDAYMADQCQQEYNHEPKPPQLSFESRPPQYDISQVEGYNTTRPEFAQHYGVDEYFVEELKMVPAKPVVASSASTLVVPAATTQEEATALTREEIYTNLVERYYNNANNVNNASANKEQYYVELMVYLISGVFLIFFMEQILQVGSKIAGRR